MNNYSYVMDIKIVSTVKNGCEEKLQDEGRSRYVKTGGGVL